MKKIFFSLIMLSTFVFANSYFDNKTNLIWQDNKEVKKNKRNWEDAKSYCDNLVLNGSSRWRLPTRLELLSISDKSKYKPAIKDGFKNTVSDYVWSNSTYKFNSSEAWYINFNYGSDAWHGKVNENYVRCVLSNKIPIFDTLNDIKLYSSVRNGNNNKNIYENKISTLDELIYSEEPFKEIGFIAEELLKIYMIPRVIKKRNMPLKISAPKFNLPKLPVFTKKRYSTDKIYQRSLKKVIAKRERITNKYAKRYERAVKRRNKKIAKIIQRYLVEVEMVKAEQKHKEGFRDNKIEQFNKGAFRMIMGGFELKKKKYDDENKIIHLVMEARRAKYSKNISLKIDPLEVEDFLDNLSNAKVFPKFDFVSNTIILKSINIKYNKNNYKVILNDNDFRPKKIKIRTNKEEYKIEFNSVKDMELALQNSNLKDLKVNVNKVEE
jgi:hypothetical protein